MENLSVAFTKLLLLYINAYLQRKGGDGTMYFSVIHFLSVKEYELKNYNVQCFKGGGLTGRLDYLTPLHAVCARVWVSNCYFPLAPLGSQPFSWL